MVKKIRYKELQEIAKETRLVLALFFSKSCTVCEKQEKDLKGMEKQLSEHGVRMVKLDVSKDDIDKKLGVQAVPTLMMWLRGINVGFRFKPDGKIFSQINGHTTPILLLNKIAQLLSSD